jgi:predicted small secreted protein
MRLALAQILVIVAALGLAACVTPPGNCARGRIICVQ